MERRGRLTLFFIVIPAAILAVLLLRNVFVDEQIVGTAARARACAGQGAGCSPRLSRLVKTPLYHEVRYTVGREQLDVRCRRALYVVGDYECAVIAK
jgi:hypothetical protein